MCSINLLNDQISGLNRIKFDDVIYKLSYAYMSHKNNLEKCKNNQKIM